MQQAGKLNPFGKKRDDPNGPLDEDEQANRYPPFMKGIPAFGTNRIIKTQSELISRIREAVGAPDDEFNQIYYPIIELYAAYVHLLPASESHHHRGPGGLFRHGLETALWATQGAERVMFARNEPPAVRRDMEPRWRCGVFLAAIAHDIGKPLSDLKITDADGTYTWGAQVEDMVTWLKRTGVQRYFLHWYGRRHQRHESLTPMVLPHVIPGAAREYLNGAGPELFEQILFAVSSRDFSARNQEHNVIFSLVREADQNSTQKDVGDPIAAGMPGALGVPLERYIMDAMRRLVRERRWKCNKNGGALWVMDGSLFVAWPRGADDIVKMLRQDKTPGIPQHADSLADVLIDRDLAVPFEAGDSSARLWPIQPTMLTEKNPDMVLHALRLDDNANVFDEVPASVAGLVGEQVTENKAKQTGAQDASSAETPDKADQPGDTSEQPTEQPPQTSAPEADSAPDNSGNSTAQQSSATEQAPAEQAPTEPAPAKQQTTEQPAEQPAESHTSSRLDNAGQPIQPEQPREQPGEQPPEQSQSYSRQDHPTAQPKQTGGNTGRSSEDTVAQAREWLDQSGHIGAILVAIAEDLADGDRVWGRDAVRLRDGTVALRHPDSWSGTGIESNQALPLLTEADWITVDSFQPMKKVRDVDGFTDDQGGSTTQPALVLASRPSTELLAIAEAGKHKSKQKQSTNKPANAPERPDDGLTSETVIPVLREAATQSDSKLSIQHQGDDLLIGHLDAVSEIARHFGCTRTRADVLITAMPHTKDDKKVRISATKPQ